MALVTLQRIFLLGFSSEPGQKASVYARFVCIFLPFADIQNFSQIRNVRKH